MGILSRDRGQTALFVMEVALWGSQEIWNLHARANGSSADPAHPMKYRGGADFSPDESIFVYRSSRILRDFDTARFGAKFIVPAGRWS